MLCRACFSRILVRVKKCERLQGLPQEFSIYLNYCRELRFDEAPDYMYLRQLFRNLMRSLGYSYDYIFDWTNLKNDVRFMQNFSATNYTLLVDANWHSVNHDNSRCNGAKNVAECEPRAASHLHTCRHVEVR